MGIIVALLSIGLFPIAAHAATGGSADPAVSLPGAPIVFHAVGFQGRTSVVLDQRAGRHHHLVGTAQ
jgi:hypothetical protein